MFRIVPWLRSDDASQKASKWTVDEVRSSRPLQRVWNGERDLSVGFGTACSRERTRCRVTTVPETQSLSSDAFLPGVAGWIGAPPGPRRVPAVRVPTVGVRHPARRPALEEQGGPAGGASVRLATTHLRRLLGKFLFQPSHISPPFKTYDVNRALVVSGVVSVHLTPSKMTQIQSTFVSECGRFVADCCDASFSNLLPVKNASLPITV